MNKIVPFQANYELVKRLGSFATWLLYFSASISIAILAIEKMDLLDKETLQNVLNSVLAFISVIYFLSDMLQDYLFQSAEYNRKDDFIDNSLKTKLSEKNSSGYFSNDDMEAGITKLGVNCFENSFFTRSISNKMLVKESIKSAVIFSLFVLVAIIADNKVSITLLQIALPFSIIQQTIKLFILNKRVSKIFFHFKQIFSDIHENKRNPLIINNVLNYEKTLSWASIPLDSKVFNKFNAELTLEWERIKNDHLS